MPTRRPVTDPASFAASCPACGARFLAHEVGKRGAPREYCSPECREVGNAWKAFRNAFVTVLPRLTLRALFQWRGELLALASSRAWNLGIPGNVTKAEALTAEEEAMRTKLAGEIDLLREALATKG